MTKKNWPVHFAKVDWINFSANANNMPNILGENVSVFSSMRLNISWKKTGTLVEIRIFQVISYGSVECMGPENNYTCS